MRVFVCACVNTPTDNVLIRVPIVRKKEDLLGVGCVVKSHTGREQHSQAVEKRHAHAPFCTAVRRHRVHTLSSTRLSGVHVQPQAFLVTNRGFEFPSQPSKTWISAWPTTTSRAIMLFGVSSSSHDTHKPLALSA